MKHQILSPYTAFVGVETVSPKNNNTNSKVRHIPIQVSKGDEHLLFPQQSFSMYQHGHMRPMPMMAMSHQKTAYRPRLQYSSYNFGANLGQ